MALLCFLFRLCNKDKKNMQNEKMMSDSMSSSNPGMSSNAMSDTGMNNTAMDTGMSDSGMAMKNTGMSDSGMAMKNTGMNDSGMAMKNTGMSDTGMGMSDNGMAMSDNSMSNTGMAMSDNAMSSNAMSGPHATATINGKVIANASKWEVVEGNIYFPPESINKSFFTSSNKSTTCPWKGQASYYNISIDGQTIKDAAWYYPTPGSQAQNIKGYVAFYGNKVQVKTS